MKALAISVGLLCAPACFAQSKACIVVQHSDQTGVATWSRNYRPLQYVWGEFPAGMKFKSGLKDGDVQKIREKGGKVIVLPQSYTHNDLEEAKKGCAE